MKMTKKIILTLIISCLVVSCGKKGDPKYKDKEYCIKLNHNLYGCKQAS